jgi:hypothetical protein
MIYLPLAVNEYMSTARFGCGVTVHDLPDRLDRWYDFELSTSRSVTVRLTNYHAEGQLLLYEGSPAGKRIGHSGAAGPTKTIGPMPLGANTYYVRVYTTAKYNTTQKYALSLICK